MTHLANYLNVIVLVVFSLYSFYPHLNEYNQNYISINFNQSLKLIKEYKD